MALKSRRGRGHRHLDHPAPAAAGRRADHRGAEDGPDRRPGRSCPISARGLAEAPEVEAIGLIADYIPDYQVTTVFASTSLVEENPDVVTRFLGAFSKGAADFNAALVDKTAGGAEAEAVVDLLYPYVYPDRERDGRSRAAIRAGGYAHQPRTPGSAWPASRTQLDWFQAPRLRRRGRHHRHAGRHQLRRDRVGASSGATPPMRLRARRHHASLRDRRGARRRLARHRRGRDRVHRRPRRAAASRPCCASSAGWSGPTRARSGRSARRRQARSTPSPTSSRTSRCLPWRTVAGNVALVLEDHRLPASERHAIVAVDVLARTKLSDFADALPRQLSGGMRQRVAIARALAVSPAGPPHGRAGSRRSTGRPATS